jgi:hypothetical protein
MMMYNDSYESDGWSINSHDELTPVSQASPPPIPTLAHERHPCQVKDTVKFTKSDGTETWAYVREVNGDLVTVIPVDEKGHVQPEM